MKKRYPFTSPKLIHHKNDLDKNWYIEFYQWSFIKNKKVRKRWYKGFKEIESLEKRYEYGMRKYKPSEVNLEVSKILISSCID